LLLPVLHCTGAEPRTVVGERGAAMKYVLVTGGVVSGLGKGVTASSIGVLLKSCGFRVTSIKIGKLAAAAARARGASVSDFSPLGTLRSNRKRRRVMAAT